MYQTKCALAIFAKTVGLSPIKTRLAQSLGQSQAETFYQYSQQEICKTAQASQAMSRQQIQLYITVAEAEGVQHEYWRAYQQQGFEIIWTGEGGLGERLSRVYSHLKPSYSSVIVIGTDSPQLEASLLLEAYHHLCQNPKEIVIGASVDGGFYLFGGAIDLPDFVFKNVVYSQHDTLQQLVHQLDSNTIYYLKTELDVDTLDDLIALAQSSGNQLTWLKEFVP